MGQQEILDFLKKKYNEGSREFYTVKEVGDAFGYDIFMHHRAFNALLKAKFIEKTKIIAGKNKRPVSAYRYIP